MDPQPTAAPDSGSGIVLRGLLLLVFLITVLAGGYFLIFRQPTQTPPPPLMEPEPLIALVVFPQAGFPGGISWGALHMLADTLPSGPNWETRYTATCSLARRGELNVPWDVMAEILNEHQQFRNFRFRLPDGRLVPDEAAARNILISGLKAVGEWHDCDKVVKAKVEVTAPMKAVYAAVDKLAQSPITEVRLQAEKTQAKLYR